MANAEQSVKERCFACGRVLGKKPLLVDTRDEQLVYVGRECGKHVLAAGEEGWQPPKGGPRLFPIPNQGDDNMKVWSISRNGQFAGTIRAKSKEQAIKDYAAWAKCSEGELSAA